MLIFKSSLQKKTSYFTDKGFISYINFLKQTRIDQYKQRNIEFIESSLADTPDLDITFISSDKAQRMREIRSSENNNSWITPEFIDFIEGKWQVNVPVNINYHSGERSQTDQLILLVIIDKINTDELKIDHWQINQSYR